MTPEKRMELMARCAALVRRQIERNGGRYDGAAFAPNLQSVIDLASIDEAHLVGVEERITQLEAIP